MRRVVILGLLLTLSACASAPEPELDLLLGGRISGAALDAKIAAAAKAPLGSQGNPVRVNMPAGEHAYLRRLRCGDGAAPSFQRQGSFGPGPFGSILDGYSVICAGAEPRSSTVFMDMYHPEHVEMAAPPGFTIVAN